MSFQKKNIIRLSFMLMLTAFTSSVSATIVLSITTVNTTCQKANGRITVHATGGAAPYNYTISGPFAPQPSGVFFNLPANSYTITVTDANSETITQNVVLTNQFNAPTVSVISSQHPTDCNTHDGTLILSGAGGVSPYMYSVDNLNYQSSNTFSNLTAGVYKYIVKDANGCTSDIYNIVNYRSIGGTCAIVQNGYNAGGLCNPYQGQVTLPNTSGGTPPYSYSTDGITYQSSSTLSMLPEGLVTIRVKDASGLIFLYSVTLIDPCPKTFIVSVASHPAQCGLSGSLTVTATEGATPYLYSLDGGTIYQNSNTFSGLPPGNYTVTVKDADGLISNKFAVIVNSCVAVAATTINSTCSNANGSIMASATNGILPITFSLDGTNYSSNNIFQNLASNNYTVYAKDQSGNTSSIPVTVNNTAGAIITSNDTIPTQCDNHSGKITVQVSGGTIPILYSLDNINFQSNAVFSNLSQGNYQVTIKDANLCTDTKPAIIRLNNNMVLHVPDTLKICEGKGTTIPGLSNATAFSWSPSTTLDNATSLTPQATPLTSTNYVILASIGVCSKEDSTYIVVKPAPIAQVGLTQTICFGGNTTLSGSGGTTFVWTPLTYLDDPAAANPTVTNALQSTTYSLQVSDNNQCTSINTALQAVSVLPPSKIFAGNDTSTIIGEQLQLNVIDVNGTGFTSYTWFPSTGLTNVHIPDPVAILNKDQTYFVEAKTQLGCIGKDTITIKAFIHPDIYVPSAFTPNSDGKNDFLKAIPIGLKIFERFSVYNKYGELVFTTTDPGAGWNGYIKSGSLAPQSFVWMASGINLKNEKIFRKGTVTLIR